MKPFPRRFIVDLDTMECYAEFDPYGVHKFIRERDPREAAIAQIREANVEKPLQYTSVISADRPVDVMRLGPLRLILHLEKT